MIEVGDRVKDSDGWTGEVTEIDTLHEVWVRYDLDGEEGIYCLVRDCHHYDPLEKI